MNFILKAFGREKLSISKKVMAGVNKMSTVDQFETIAAELAIEKQYDYVICGHIHQPQKSDRKLSISAVKNDYRPKKPCCTKQVIAKTG